MGFICCYEFPSGVTTRMVVGSECCVRRSILGNSFLDVLSGVIYISLLSSHGSSLST